MRVVAISDTHTFEDQITVPDGDVLIHAGDFTISGTVSEVSNFCTWLHRQPHRHKIIVAGNHDWLLEKFPVQARAFIKNVPGACYLQDSSIVIEGVTFYGAPWQPRFMDWAFNVDRGNAIKQYWDRISSCEVLITHGPPWGILDTVKSLEPHLGCEELIKAVLRVKPRVHVFGHIHGGYGQRQLNGVRFINASICNEAYHPINEPVVFEVEL